MFHGTPVASATSVAKALSTPRRPSSHHNRTVIPSTMAKKVSNLIDLENSVDLSGQQTLAKSIAPPLTTTIMPTLATAKSEIKSLLGSISGIHRGSVSKSTIKAWIEKLKVVESFLETPANDSTLLRPDASNDSCVDYDHFGPTELSDHCLTTMNSQFGPQVSLDRKLVIRMCGLMVPFTDHSMNDVANLTTSHLSALDKIR